jgi:acetyl esterase/lipase
LPKTLPKTRLTITEGIEDQTFKGIFRQLDKKLPKSPGKVMIYFHGNAEDIGTCLYLMSALRELLGVRVIAMEYRGYGLFGGSHKSSTDVLEDALTVFDFTVNVLEVKPHDIFLIGRSIGCSLVAHVARYRKPAFVVMISPFKTLQEAAAAVVGWLLSTLVAQRFDNIECLKHVKSPVMIIHGQKDELIPCSHA